MNPILLIAAVVAGSFAGLAVLASYLKCEMLFLKADKNPDALAPRERFLLRAVRRCGFRPHNRAPFAVLVLDPGPGAEDPAALEAALRPLLRRGDELIGLDRGRVAALAGTEPRGIQPLAERLLAGLDRPAAGEEGLRRALRIGAAAFPQDATDGESLLEAAESALARTDPLRKPWAQAVEESAPDEEPPPDPESARLIDPLTGLLRPERLGSAARKLISSWRLRSKAVSALVLDIDRLDQINERFGREAGDTALRAVSEILQKGVRESDLIGRLGGDEFLVILDAAPDQAEAAGRRLIETIRREPVRTGGTAVHLSVSVGCAGYPEFRGSIAELLQAAEWAMFSARESGHNLCVRFHPALRRMYRRTEEPADRF